MQAAGRHPRGARIRIKRSMAYTAPGSRHADVLERLRGMMLSRSGQHAFPSFCGRLFGQRCRILVYGIAVCKPCCLSLFGGHALADHPPRVPVDGIYGVFSACPTGWARIWEEWQIAGEPSGLPPSSKPPRTPDRAASLPPRPSPAPPPFPKPQRCPETGPFARHRCFEQADKCCLLAWVVA